MRRDASAARLPLTLLAVASGLVLLAQAPLALDLLDPDPLFEAGHAKGVLAANAALAVLTVAVAAAAPLRLRGLALLPGGLLAGAAIAASATFGGRLLDMAIAALTLAAAWWVGRVVLQRVARRPRWARVVVIELVVGLGSLGLAILLLGRLGLIAWWSAGAPTIVLGALGAWVGARNLWTARRHGLHALTSSPIAVACAGLLLQQLAWAVVWLSAPEIMFDALYGKAYLPHLWASSGAIDPLLTHPVLNVSGLAQVVAVPGHVVGATDGGRHLQMFAWVLLVTTTWWWGGRDSTLGPLAALAVGITPHVVWQATTAYDDLMLTAGAAALALAVVRSGDQDAEDRPFRTALAMGLLAGACLWLKLNLLAVVVVLAVGWTLAGPARRFPHRLGGLALGAGVVAAPALVLRWVDTGNPVFPSYNHIFRSDRYPAIDERFNFPFWPDADLGAALRAPYESVVHPWLMNEATPQGAFGLLVASTVVAVLVGWRSRDRRGTLILWTALVVSLVLWWTQFRYLRYALPLAMVGVVLLLAQTHSWRANRVGVALLLVAVAAGSALYLPSTVASFWNVPHRDLPFAAAFGRWDSHDYLRTVFPEKDALDAFQRAAPPDAIALSDAHQRVFLRDRDLSPVWEVDRLLQLSGSAPQSAADALQRVRALGIEWALVTGPNRTSAGFAWLPSLLREHGEPVFSDRGWDLFRLTRNPRRPRPFAICDVHFAGRSGCWTGIDRVRGLSGTEVAQRSVPVCAGRTLAVRARTADGGAPAQISIDSDAGHLLAGHTGGDVHPGGWGVVHATAPSGTRHLTVTIRPGANGSVLSARLGLSGRCSS